MLRYCDRHLERKLSVLENFKDKSGTGRGDELIEVVGVCVAVVSQMICWPVHDI